MIGNPEAANFQQQASTLIGCQPVAQPYADPPNAFDTTNARCEFRSTAQTRRWFQRRLEGGENQPPDSILGSLGRPCAEIKWDQALTAWNLFADVANSVGDAGRDFNAADARAKGVYQKLFWGNNLPSITPEGRRYIPEWSGEERSNLNTVLSQGLKLFEGSIFEWDMRLIS